MSDSDDLELGRNFATLVAESDLIEARCTGCGEETTADLSLVFCEFLVRHTRDCGMRSGATVVLRNGE